MTKEFIIAKLAKLYENTEFPQELEEVIGIALLYKDQCSADELWALSLYVDGQNNLGKDYTHLINSYHELFVNKGFIIEDKETTKTI